MTDMCDVNTLQMLLKQAAQKMKDLFGDKLCSIILFGSYARGDYNDESDIDLFVLVDMETTELAKYRSEVSKFSSRLGLEYDILMSVKLQDKATFDTWESVLPFFINLKKEGVQVYAA